MRFPQLSDAGRKRLIIGSIATGATVVVLAGTIFISSALSSPGGSSVPPSIQVTSEDVSAQQTADEAYQKALDAYRSGDSTAAAAILQQQLAQNPNDARARTLLEQVTSKKPAAPAANGDTPDAAKPDPSKPDKYAKPVKDVGALLPASVSKFQIGEPVVSEGDASLSADPTERALQGRVSHALFAVHDLRSAAAAKKYVAKVSKPVYPKNGSDVSVGGYAGYFGTDGQTKATIVYVRGRYVFETILSTVSQPPSTLKDVAMSVAAAYRD